MIEMRVIRNDQLIIESFFDDEKNTLEGVLKNAEMYITNEQLNNAGECLIKVKFAVINKWKQTEKKKFKMEALGDNIPSISDDDINKFKKTQSKKKQ